MAHPRILINALSVGAGGGRAYVVNLLRELSRDQRGFRFTLLVADDQRPGLETGALEVEVMQLARMPRALRLVRRIGAEVAGFPLRQRHFDLLYCIADLAPPIASVPTVVALRNLNIYDRRCYDTPRLRGLFHLARIGVRRARRVIFPSRAAAELIRAVVSIPEERVAIVPHGVSPEAFDAPRGQPTGPPYLFVPAALERHKNLEVAIQALRWITDPDLEIRIAGGSETDPAYAHSLSELAERTGVASRVTFLGAVPYQEIPALYQGASALVFPSLLETFGHPLLEAMAAGIPILASDIPATREVAGDVAHYFPALDPRTLAREVNQLQGNSAEMAARIARGRARAAGFSWQRSADLLCDTFGQALRGG